MTKAIQSIANIAHQFDAIVLDQWGVLHDGSAPYETAPACLSDLHSVGTRLAVLSNSGKRAVPNASRIASMGFAEEIFEIVMTSGEALFLDFQISPKCPRKILPIERSEGDALDWAQGLDIMLSHDIEDAETILLMGLPDGMGAEAFDDVLQTALSRKLPLYCSNPDLTSPRAGGALVVSPGALAKTYEDAGGTVHLYGKPHLPIFRALEAKLNCAPDRLLMVGDSLHHDIQGGANAGWKTLLIEGGIHEADLDGTGQRAQRLADVEGTPRADFTMTRLR